MSSKLSRLKHLYDQGGSRELLRGIYDFIWYNIIAAIARTIYQPPSIYIHSKLSNRWNIFNNDWDLLIILDTCRPDAIAEVAEEYEFINNINRQWSVGSHSAEWMTNTFTEDYIEDISDTCYITSNPHVITVFEKHLNKDHNNNTKKQYKRLTKYNSNSVVDINTFYRLVRLYNVSTDYSEFRFPSPRSVTNHTIEMDRTDDPPRIIAHYMPPHRPYLAKNRDGEIVLLDEPRSDSWEAYIDNLRWVLNEIELLLDNVDRDRVVITADHGENIHGPGSRHVIGMLNPSARRVPWVSTTASDDRTYIPDIDTNIEQTDTEEMLKSLGYL